MAVKPELPPSIYVLGVLLVFIGAVCLLPPVIAGVVTFSKGGLVEPSGRGSHHPLHHHSSPYAAAAIAAGRC